MKKFASFLLISLTCLLVSCSKEGDEGGNGSGTAVLGISVRDLPEVVEVPANQTQTYELVVTANPGPSAVLDVTIGTDETLVAKYNLANGTSYEMLPAAAYELSSAPLMLMRFNKTSAPGTLKLKGAGCELDKTYLLPLVIGQVKGAAAYEAPEENVVFVVFKMLEAQIEGAGTAASPYLLGDLETFKKLGNMLKDGETVYVKLAGDIDFAGETWAPATVDGGYVQINTAAKPVSLDGDNHKIKNVVAACGLFSVLEGTVKNLTFENVKIEAGAQRAGILADQGGREESTDKVIVENVIVTGSTIFNTGYTGGLFGSLLNGEVKNVNIDCQVSGDQRVGGIVGHAMNCSFTDCVTSGDVTSTIYYVGGQVGMMFKCTMKNCSATGNVTSSTGSYARAGGLVGQLIGGGTLEKCFATGSVTGNGYFAGALIGVAQAYETVNDVVEMRELNLSKCYATGSVSLTGNAKKDAGAGGLVGRVDGGNINVTDCYSTSAIEADRYSSGFIGDIGGDNKTVLNITNGFASGDLSKLGPDANGVYSDGIVIGCTRTPSQATIKCKGFVAWDLNNKLFGFTYAGSEPVPSTGNYHGKEGTISSQAKAFGWDEAVWDLTSDVPKLK